ncbi:hypothetical protein GCM10019059_07780 [Camelimonas fluminis]|uniref:Phage GP46 family protein n=1 Tax=Camelimonas fluminis TaxID=1576911 RepID=A0ABV7UFU0_9HYPH|nr:phage GP46 family protein [Camelimonas fluminis]GHE51032.1 hypothetical protein GCM10019059_07780 [Camelimonas fluminis]
MTRIIDPAGNAAPSSPDLVLIADPVLGADRADFALAGPSDQHNPLGLCAGQTLATAIALCLMTDARGAVDQDDGDQIDLRGWPGDGFDVDAARGEAALGNTVWERFRWPADAANASQIAARFAAALEPLRRQGVIGEVRFDATPDPARNRITINVRIAAPSGRVIYDGPFAGLWEAILAVRDPLSPR